MKKIILAILIIVSSTLCYAEQSQWEEVIVKGGFLTGNSFRNLSSAQKSGYAVGFYDGIFISSLFGAQIKQLQWFERCTKGMSSLQIVAILDKFLNENPQRWHEPMNILAYSAMQEACNK